MSGSTLVRASSGFIERLISPKSQRRVDVLVFQEKTVQIEEEGEGELTKATCSNILDVVDEDTLAEYQTIFDVLDVRFC